MTSDALFAKVIDWLAKLEVLVGPPTEGDIARVIGVSSWVVRKVLIEAEALGCVRRDGGRWRLA